MTKRLIPKNIPIATHVYSRKTNYHWAMQVFPTVMVFYIVWIADMLGQTAYLYRISEDGLKKETIYQWDGCLINEWAIHRDVLYYAKEIYETTDGRNKGAVSVDVAFSDASGAAGGSCLCTGMRT